MQIRHVKSAVALVSLVALALARLGDRAVHHEALDRRSRRRSGSGS